MNDSITVRLNESFKEDIEGAAEQRNLSPSEWLREAARRQLQKDIKLQKHE